MSPPLDEGVARERLLDARRRALRPATLHEVARVDLVNRRAEQVALRAEVVRPLPGRERAVRQRELVERAPRALEGPAHLDGCGVPSFEGRRFTHGHGVVGRERHDRVARDEVSRTAHHACRRREQVALDDRRDLRLGEVFGERACSRRGRPRSCARTRRGASSSLPGPWSSLAKRAGPRTWPWSPRAASLASHAPRSDAARASAPLASGEARALRGVAQGADSLRDVAAEVGGEAGEVARGDLGDRARERRSEVLARVPDLGQRCLLVGDEPPGALLEGRVVTNHVRRDREGAPPVRRGDLARCVHVDEPEEARRHPGRQLGAIERLVVAEERGVERGEGRRRAPEAPSGFSRRSPRATSERCGCRRRGGRAPVRWRDRRPGGRRGSGRSPPGTRRTAFPRRAPPDVTVEGPDPAGSRGPREGAPRASPGLRRRSRPRRPWRPPASRRARTRASSSVWGRVATCGVPGVSSRQSLWQSRLDCCY